MSATVIAQQESKRNIAFKRLQDCVLCAKKCYSDSSQLERLETWCSRLEAIMDTFNEAHSKLMAELTKVSDDKRINEQTTFQEQADDMYFEILEAKRKFWPNPADSIPKQSTSNSKLPPMKLPTFSGNLKDFPGYIDLFNTLVHRRTDLTQVEKFQYLITSLVGEPVNIIRAFPISEANYLSAYEALTDRYNNKRYLAFVCWEQILNAKPTNGTALSLRALLDIYNENISMLTSLGLPTPNWDFVLFHSLLTKLDKASREAFELSCKGNDFPSVQLLKSFLQDRCNALERSSLTNFNISNQAAYQPKSNHANKRPNNASNPTMLLAQQSTSNACILCKRSHPLWQCQEFLAKTPQQRSEAAKVNKLCINCLRSNHTTSKCMSTFACKTCNQRHNTLLHFSTNKQQNQNRLDQRPNLTDQSTKLSNTNDNVITPVTSLSNISMNTSKDSSFVLLATAEVEVKDGYGLYQRVRILLDPGSQSHIITNACARRLGLTKFKSNTPLSGISEVLTKSSSKVLLEIRPVGKQSPSFNTEAVCLDKICGNMPTHPVDVNKCNHIANLKMADENYHMSRPVDILIGGEIFPLILIPGTVDGENLTPTALNTVFGYILMGRTASTSMSNSQPLAINHVSLDAHLDVAIQRLWELDDVPTSEKCYSADDLRCEDIYQSTHRRDADGRYIVQLPFRDQSPPSFDGSYSIAFRRFVQLEKRLLQNAKFKEEYQEHIMEYLSSGHMEEVATNDYQSPSAYYIPHHAVVKPDRKLRVVYDASTKDTNGISLNDSLLTGPKLQSDITNILLRFRLHEIVFTADVRQMYRQINITEEHRDYQRILFRSCPTDPIQEFQINRVTFGVSSAPFLAIRTMHQLAQDERETFPDAADLLLSDLYVDDVVTGAPDLQTALSHQAQLIGIMRAGGFELRKWSSNDQALLQNIPLNHQAVPDITFDSDCNFVKVLGLAWNSNQDIFNYQVNVIARECTKRTMLSELARIYDPIGLLTPLTFLAKHLIQRLWLRGASWDDPVPSEINQFWEKYTEQLPCLSQLSIPRRLTQNDAVSYQLHGFCDASEAGMAAAVYLRTTSRENCHSAALISARSRVSPTKRRTLPRLELCGASLLADLLHYVSNTLSPIIEIESINAWSDSMIVLAWIRSSSSTYKAFVGNRISNIQRKTSSATWRHISGKENPSDCASRGLTPEELINHELWWKGPDWLIKNQDHWPTQPNTFHLSHQLDSSVSCEKRAAYVMTSQPAQIHIIDYLLNRFSSLRKVQRIIAYCRRVINPLRKIKLGGFITEIEMHESLMIVVKHVQQTEFCNEIHNLRSKGPLPKNIKSLNPFLDKEDILRVGGRLARSELDFNAKHPALLPRKHILTDRIIQCVHNENLHPGVQTMLYLLLQNFWILSAKRAVRHILSNCYRCFRIKPVPCQPEMADLPRSRVTQLKAFQSVGCDYAGPFNIYIKRHRGARTIKAYLCLFVCFVTKALHLELALDLSTEAFIAALRRFIARRGRCNFVHSDCGTNFKGAQTQLRELMRSACAAERIEFKFNPPGAPHFGGIWEAGVKSVKTHLYRVIGAQILTYEELHTLFTQVEAVLNSRPLCPVSTDPNDLTTLTPGHFLTLAPLTSLPSHDYTHTSITRLTRWQLIQKMHQDFWSRWHKEYLTTLTQRLKWTNSSRKININQLVIIKDDTAPPLHWRMGRILQLYHGRDGIARSATIKTSQGTINRPLVKLCPIPDGQ